MGERVLITGSSGMLGSSLARYLVARDYEVIGVDLRPPSDDDWLHHHGDIRDTDAMTDVIAGASAVVHCASALPSYRADQISDTILNGTTSVLTASWRAGVQRVVHISSTAVYGLPKVVPTPETHQRKPVDPYSRAKAEAETVAEEFRARDMCVSIVRPKTFLGPGRLGLFGMLFEWAEQGHNFPVLGSGDVRIQMLAIEDLLAAIGQLLVADNAVANDTYNLGAHEFGTLREDFQAVLDRAGHGKRVVPLPARSALAGLRFLELTRMSPVYGRLLHKLLADSYVSIDKARERLEFTPRLSNKDAILNTYEWWRVWRRDAPSGNTGQTSREAWRQGALSLAKAFF